jgi:hypothetical protein
MLNKTFICGSVIIVLCLFNRPDNVGLAFLEHKLTQVLNSNQILMVSHYHGWYFICSHFRVTAAVEKKTTSRTSMFRGKLALQREVSTASRTLYYFSFILVNI